MAVKEEQKTITRCKFHQIHILWIYLVTIKGWEKVEFMKFLKENFI
jgi:hypothetical protein